MSAALAKVSAAAWRRSIPPITEEICAPLLQHTVAGKRLLLGAEADSPISSTVEHTQPLTGRRIKARLGNRKPANAYLMPSALLCPCRMYTSNAGHSYRSIPVRSMRPRGCKNDKVSTIKNFIARTPLFRKIKDHPLIPDEENVWVLTAEGEAFFDNLGWLIWYNTELGVYVGDALDDDNEMIIKKFCCPEFRHDAPGRNFDGVTLKNQNFKKQGEFIRDIIKKYCSEVNLSPEFEEYKSGLINCPRHFSKKEAETLLSNAALLSSEGAITCIMRGDSWLRRAVKFRGTPYERSKRRIVLVGIANELCGENGESLMDIIRECPYLYHSIKVKLERAKQNEQAQQDRSSGKKAMENSVKNAVEKPLPQVQAQQGKSSEMKAAQDPVANAVEKAIESPMKNAVEKPLPQVQAQQGKSSVMKAAQNPVANAVKKPPMTEEEEEKEKRRKKMTLDENTGDDVVGAQRDLYVHGFDKKLQNDKDVKALNNTWKYTSGEIAEYQRWKLRLGLAALQKWFIEAGYPSILGIRDLLSSNRRGKGAISSEANHLPRAAQWSKQRA